MKNHRFCRPSLELLEDRWTPAGTVTGSFSHGTWTLIGDDQANNIEINPTATPGAFTVAGFDATTVTGVTNPTGVKNIVAKLFGGEDVFSFNDTQTRTKLAGSLTINGGTDANAVYINNAVVGNKVTVHNGANATGIDEFDLTDSIVKGPVFINNGEGGTDTAIVGKTAGSNFIGGLTVVNGTGRDDCTITDTNVAGNIVARNGLPDAMNNAGYFETYNVQNTTGRSVVGGSVAIKYEAGDIMSVDIQDSEVRRNVTINHGSGMTETNFDGYHIAQPVLIRGNLTLLGTGPVLITVGKLGGTGSGKGLVVGKNLTIVTGDQSDTITASRLRVIGATRIQTGAGADVVLLEDSRFLGLRSFSTPFGFQLLTGAGNDTVSIETATGTTGPTQVLGPALVRLGSGDDTLTTGYGGDATRRVQLFRPAFLLGDADTDTFNRLNLKSAPGAFVKALFETINV